MPNLKSWVTLVTRPGGVLWITTPYAIAGGGFGLLSYFLNQWWGWSAPSVVLSLLIIVLVFLLFTILQSGTGVFRDARQHLGSISNALVDLARQITSFVDWVDREPLLNWLILYGRLITVDLGQEDRLPEVLSNCKAAEKKTLDEVLDESGTRSLAPTVLSWISQDLSRLDREDAIARDYRVAMGPNLTALTNGLGACRRVQKAQLPVDFSVLAGISILLFCALLPFVLVEDVGIWVSPVMAGATYLLVGMLQLALQMRDPFGTDPNDLDMDEFEKSFTSGIKAVSRAQLPITPSLEQA